MPLLTEAELAGFPEPTTADVVPHCVARYWDLHALADRTPARVIGPDARLRDRPGFAVDFLTRGSAQTTPAAVPFPSVLMPVTGLLLGKVQARWLVGVGLLIVGSSLLAAVYLPFGLGPRPGAADAGRARRSLGRQRAAH